MVLYRFCLGDLKLWNMFFAVVAAVVVGFDGFVVVHCFWMLFAFSTLYWAKEWSGGDIDEATPLVVPPSLRWWYGCCKNGDEGEKQYALDSYLYQAFPYLSFSLQTIYKYLSAILCSRIEVSIRFMRWFFVHKTFTRSLLSISLSYYLSIWLSVYLSHSIF